MKTKAYFISNNPFKIIRVVGNFMLMRNVILKLIFIILHSILNSDANISFCHVETVLKKSSK